MYKLFHVKQFAYHTVSGVSYLRILAVCVVFPRKDVVHSFYSRKRRKLMSDGLGGAGLFMSPENARMSTSF